MNKVDRQRAEHALDVEMEENDADARTVRAYFKKLLSTLWEEGEGFSGKRPFGNSSWKYEVFFALVKAKLIEGVIGEDGLEDHDEEGANKLVQNAISLL